MILRRDLKLFFHDLIPAVVLTLLLAVCCVIAGLAASKGAERQTDPVDVALVDNEDSLLSRMGISMVTDQGYMSSLMTIGREANADEALKKMEAGEYGAVIDLPDGYMEKIMHGENCTGTIYVSDALENEGEMIEAIADFGSRLLTAGQLGVFAGERVIAQNGLGEEVHAQFLEDTNARLITFALDAYDSVFTFEVLDYGDTGMSMTDYYAACWIVLLLFVVGLFFPGLYITDCKGSIYARLRTRGMSDVNFMLGKIIYPAIFRLLLCAVIAAVFKARFLPLAIAAVYITLLTSSIAVALSKRGGWSVLIIAISTIALFMQGGLVPRTMLPEILPALAQYTPSGAALEAVIYAMGGKADLIGAAVVAAIYTALSVMWVLGTLRDMPKGNEEVRL